MYSSIWTTASLKAAVLFALTSSFLNLKYGLMFDSSMYALENRKCIITCRRVYKNYIRSSAISKGISGRCVVSIEAKYFRFVESKIKNETAIFAYNFSVKCLFSIYF